MDMIKRKLMLMLGRIKENRYVNGLMNFALPLGVEGFQFNYIAEPNSVRPIPR